MGIKLRVDHHRRETYAVAVGAISLADVRSHIEEERAAGGLAYPELIDAREATPDVTAAEVRDVVDQLRHMALDETLGPTAIVVGSEVAFGMLRMLEILIEEVTIIRPFRDYEDAVRWLEGLRQAG